MMPAAVSQTEMKMEISWASLQQHIQLLSLELSTGLREVPGEMLNGRFNTGSRLEILTLVRKGHIAQRFG